MANMAILRVQKIKTVASLAARGKHNFRERETLNADADRTALNSGIGAKSTAELVSKVADLLPQKRRKDAVIGLEYLITASPEHFGADWRETKNHGMAYFNDAIKWLAKRHGAENIVCATVHLDESTPHLAAFVVPKTKDGRLSAKDFVGGSKVLTNMQTDFASAVGLKHGLERGIERSKAVHQDNAKIAPMTAERLQLRKQVKALEAEIERLTKRVADSDTALAKAQAELATRDAIASSRIAQETTQMGELIEAAHKAQAEAKAKTEALAKVEDELAKVQRRFERQQQLNIDNLRVIQELKDAKKEAAKPEPAPDRDAAYAALVAEAKQKGTVFDIKPGAQYVGPIKEISACGRFAIQDQGRGAIVIHDLAKLEGRYVVGQKANIAYRDGVGWDKLQAVGRQQERPGIGR